METSPETLGSKRTGALGYYFCSCSAGWKRLRANWASRRMVPVSHSGSARIMQKAGMRYEKTVRDSDADGNWADRHQYAIHKAEYIAAQERPTL